MPHIKLKKDIYLGKNLQDLYKQSQINASSVNTRLLAKSFMKVFAAANAEIIEGDEEKAYILFMKCLNIHEIIKSSSDYKKDKNYFDSICTPNNVKKSIEECEKLAKNLRNRYDENEAKEVVRKLELDTAESKKDITPVEILPKINDEILKLPSEFISVTELYTLITELKNYLIMDVRRDFEASHILNKYCINIPENIIEEGCTSTKIENRISNAALNQWKSRHNFETVILVDWDTNPTNIQPSLPISHLKNALSLYTGAPLKNKLLILEGGYEEWLLCYPTISTNSSVRKPSKQPIVHIPSLDEIRYDSNIFEKPSQKLNVDQPVVDIKNIIRDQMLPTIDRRNKPRTQDQQNGLGQEVISKNTEYNDVISKSTEKKDVIIKNTKKKKVPTATLR